MKSLLVICLCFLGVSAQAQQRDGITLDMAQQVKFLVQNHLQSLPPQSRQYVTESLGNVIQAFAMNGINVRPGSGHRPPPLPPPLYPGPAYPPANLICDSSDNTLHDLNASGRLIHDFAARDNCLEAKDYAASGQPFCDYSYNTLHTAEGRLVHDFRNREDCQTAREAILHGGNFCDSSDNTFHDSTGRLIYDFSNADDCQAALTQSP